MIFNLGGKDKEEPKFNFEPARTVEQETLQRWRTASAKPAPTQPTPLFKKIGRIDDDEEQTPVRASWADSATFSTSPVVTETESVTVKTSPAVRAVEPSAPRESVGPSDPEREIRKRFGNEVQSALGVGTVIEGKFSFESPVRIDGTLKGEVVATSVLIVGEQAVVEASVKVGSLIVFGRVKGDVEAKELVEIKRSGTLDGNIKTARIVVEEGGVFRGKCNI